jgi:hypothetical protein
MLPLLRLFLPLLEPGLATCGIGGVEMELVAVSVVARDDAVGLRVDDPLPAVGLLGNRAQDTFRSSRQILDGLDVAARAPPVLGPGRIQGPGASLGPHLVERLLVVGLSIGVGGVAQ